VPDYARVVCVNKLSTHLVQAQTRRQRRRVQVDGEDVHIQQCPVEGDSFATAAFPLAGRREVRERVVDVVAVRLQRIHQLVERRVPRVDHRVRGGAHAAHGHRAERTPHPHPHGKGDVRIESDRATV
jgi:hypothetical protein